MEKIRAFVALEMPEGIKRALDEISFRLRKELADVPVRWVPVENIHLTLKFLGDISRDQMPAIAEVIRDQTANLRPQQIHLNGLGAFPNIRRARVIWIGLDLPSSFAAFQQSLEKSLEAINIPSEDRAFTPHLTLGRVRGHARPTDLDRIRDVLEGEPDSKSTPATANKVTLFSSQLKPSGSVYNALSQFVLTNTDEESH